MARFWLALLAALAACSGNDDDRFPAMPDPGKPSTGGTRAEAGSGSDPRAGEGNEGGAAGSQSLGGEGGGIVYEEGMVPVEVPGLCNPAMQPADDELGGIDVSGITLLSTTSDELSVAFSTGSGVDAKLFVADRQAAGADFAAPSEVAIPIGYEVVSGAALSSDGLELVLVKNDQSGFGLLARGERGAAFGAEPNESRFARINAQKPMSGRSVGWPVLTDDGKSLYFVSYFGQALVVQSSLTNGQFSLGTEIDEFTLGGPEGEYKLLSGISADERAIFFFDEASGHSMALFRSRPGGPFYDPLDLGERHGVAPNADCSKLYSSLDGALATQLVE